MITITLHFWLGNLRPNHLTRMVSKPNYWQSSTEYRYVHKQHEGGGKTFCEILTDAGALDIFLGPSMLSEFV